MTTSTTTRKSATLIAAAVIAAAAFAPSASAMPGLSTELQSSSVQDLRSPDARDAAVGSSPASPVSEPVIQDLRSPDVRDAAIGYAPQPVSEPVVTGGSGDGFDWVSGAIGAACIGGLILLLLAFTGTRRGFGRRHALHT